MSSSSSRGTGRVTYRYTRRRWHYAMALIDWLGSIMFGCAKAIARRRGQADAHSTGEPHQILIIQLDHLGDAIISLPMLRALRARYPSACIDVLCGPWNREWFESLSEVDHVRELCVNRFARHKRYSPLHWIPALIHCALLLRRRRYDLAIDVRGELPHALLMWLCGARTRVGWACGGGHFLLTHSAVYVKGRTELASRWSLLRAIGIAAPPKQVDRDYDPGEPARAEIARRLAQLEIAQRPLVVLHIGAGTQAKRWPSHHWRELALRLRTLHDATVVLVGGSADRALAQQIASSDSALLTIIKGSAATSAPARLQRIHDWTGTLSIRQLAALLRRATLFVGADSGPAHLAAAVDATSVVLFSGTNTAPQWRPTGTHVHLLQHAVPCAPCHREVCPLADHACMEGIAPYQVLRVVGEMLSRQPNGRLATPFAQPSVALDGAVIRRAAGHTHFVSSLI